MPKPRIYYQCVYPEDIADSFEALLSKRSEPKGKKGKPTRPRFAEFRISSLRDPDDEKRVIEKEVIEVVAPEPEVKKTERKEKTKKVSGTVD